MQRQLFLRSRAGWTTLAAAALLVAALNGCGPLREFITPTAPAVSAEWATLLADIRSYERSIGFTDTANFSDVAKDQAAYPFCGHTSRLALPWSYQDPAIQWRDAASTAECRALAADDDWFFRRLEAAGESATPLTAAMLAGKLDRFVYLVIHEDCHDQFELTHGVEEALCDFVTHQAMIAFAGRQYGLLSREQRSISRYARTQAEQARATSECYEQAALLYARFRRGEITQAVLLRERAGLFAGAASSLGLAPGELNNVSLAMNMMYSRYYPLIDEVYAAEDHDLARTVAFFMKVDRQMPVPATQNGRSIAQVRAEDNATIEAVRAALRGGAG